MNSHNSHSHKRCSQRESELKTQSRASKYNSHHWQTWMQASLKGDQDAYRLLLSDLKLWLSAFYCSRVPACEVDDLVQETLLSIHKKRHTFDPNQSFGPWLTAVAKHRWIDHMRKVGRLNETEFNEADFHETTMEMSHEVEYGAERDVLSLLNKIPAAQADVIRLVKLQQLSLKEASDQTGHSVPSIKVMIHRGMKKLQKAAKKQAAAISG